MDINIQGSEDGIQLSRSLVDENVAIVYISAYSDPQTLQEAAVTVPYGFLVKPFREADLMAVLHIVVSRVKKEHLDGKKQTTGEVFRVLAGSRTQSVALVHSHH
jgi:AmiR/NasT family two-component response regulator